MGDERPLPPGWTRYHDLATGKFFWVNKLVRPHEYSWVHPLDINPSPKQSPPPALQISWDGKTYGKGLRISWHGKTKSGADQRNFVQRLFGNSSNKPDVREAQYQGYNRRPHSRA
ncbi:hypothetical protein SISNIDRAFT_552145 [Sistotremastrum niveocremeum HHB9708]|uniref:WW domain-containing protein n=1 Tax=Sistotremastrum niveocremeum HHB9708 TaxID=1314777 RepID=A0A164Q669_9AGAM|nr:hypothetical protein SISNIDRAFT_552145 [Sistotremastrum niveocremeum HHB9708]